MFKFFNDALEAVRKGNEYRKGKFAPVDIGFVGTRKIHDNYKKTCCYAPVERKSPTEIDQFKAKFHYWDEWTGSRYVRRENPFLKMSMQKRSKLGIIDTTFVLGSVCRSDSVTGEWKAL